jgi:hypothetical protein
MKKKLGKNLLIILVTLVFTIACPKPEKKDNTGALAGIFLLSQQLTTSPDLIILTKTGNMITKRQSHTATLLNNGKVLIVGGNTGGGSSTAVSSAELYDPTTGVFTATGSMANLRSSHTATLLSNGKVLVACGNGGNLTSGSIEIYDPSTGLFSSGSTTFSTGLEGQGATLLNSGSVLFSAGLSVFSGTKAESYLYNPTTNTMTTSGSLINRRSGHSAIKLSDGKVLVAGGVLQSELYNNGVFSATGSMISTRTYHTAVLLANGEVLFSGGDGVDNFTQEIYNASTASFRRATELQTARYYHTASLLKSGKVLLVGGRASIGTTAINKVELYDPTEGTTNTIGVSNVAAYSQAAVVLSDGRVLITGGSDSSSNSLNTAEIYTP